MESVTVTAPARVIAHFQWPKTLVDHSFGLIVGMQENDYVTTYYLKN